MLTWADNPLDSVHSIRLPSSYLTSKPTINRRILVDFIQDMSCEIGTGKHCDGGSPGGWSRVIGSLWSPAFHRRWNSTTMGVLEYDGVKHVCGTHNGLHFSSHEPTYPKARLDNYVSAAPRLRWPPYVHHGAPDSVTTKSKLRQWWLPKISQAYQQPRFTFMSQVGSYTLPIMRPNYLLEVRYYAVLSPLLGHGVSLTTTPGRAPPCPPSDDPLEPSGSDEVQ